MAVYFFPHETGFPECYDCEVYFEARLIQTRASLPANGGGLGGMCTIHELFSSQAEREVWNNVS